VTYVRNRSQIIAINDLMSFNFAVVFTFDVFPFPQSKAQFLGDVPMNRRNTANCLPPF